MDGKSLNITDEKIGKLKAIIPEAFIKNIKTVTAEKPEKVITLDRLFKVNDQLKTKPHYR